MTRNSQRVWCAGLVIAATLACWIPVISTAKPKPPPPPPPPPPPTGIWSYYDAHGNPYGGLRDPNTGLVWGFDAAAISGWATAWNAAMNLSLVGTACCANPNGCDYQQWSNCYWGRNDANWRIPTKAELTTAWQNGLFHKLDYSPDAGMQSYYDSSGQYVGGVTSDGKWSSTTLKGGHDAYQINENTGVWSYASTNFSSINYVPVRGPVSP